MMLSRNTVRAQSRNLLKKLNVDDLSQLRGYFENILDGTADSTRPDELTEMPTEA